MTDNGVTPGQRIDQWLWCARFAKSRTLAQALIVRGKIRVNRAKVTKPSHWLKLGDVVTLSLGPKVRIVEVRDIDTARRSAPEAARLFLELTPVRERTTSAFKPNAGDASSSRPAEGQLAASPAVRVAGSGRPTKQDRRAIDRLKDRFSDQ